MRGEGWRERAYQGPILRPTSAGASRNVDEPGCKFVLIGVFREWKVQQINSDLQAFVGDVSVVYSDRSRAIERKRVMIRRVVIGRERQLELVSDTKFSKVVVRDLVDMSAAELTPSSGDRQR